MPKYIDDVAWVVEAEGIALTENISAMIAASWLAGLTRTEAFVSIVEFAQNEATSNW